MKILHTVLFLFYSGLLAWQDIRTRRLDCRLLAAGSLTGLLLLLALILRGNIETARLWQGYLPGLTVGLGLLALSRAAKEAIGEGDALCFISFAFWQPWDVLLSLLFGSLLLAGVTGLFLMMVLHRNRKLRLPFCPFVWAAAILQSLLVLWTEV